MTPQEAEASTALITKIRGYNPDVDEALISKACVFGSEAHGEQKRASGEPYFLHPLAVSDILASFRLDNASILTGLLHDTVEDTDVTLEDLKREFGEEVSTLVDGVTKLTQLEEKSETVKQAENFRKLVVAMSEDIRVLMVKLADRLHNMRTIGHIKSPEKRQRIARETMEIYATLAERIGMRKLKEELQDLSFAELYPEARDSVLNRLRFLREEGQDLVNRTVVQIEALLKEHGVEAVVSGREKKPYSIWRKMEDKDISFEQLADIMAFRIIVPDEMACYHALGVIHATYHMIPNHFKDYISTPKPNGYRSLHTAVMGPERQRIEIQIRTREMHSIAEYGVAAHWSYKQSVEYGKNEGARFRWIRELLDILEYSSEPEEFLEDTRMEMYHDQVFCFTPKGDLIGLPRGATPVDFAFAVHSAVGRTCVGAKVNGRIVPLKTRLENGDQVDIIRSKTQTPSPSWERFVVTGKARSEIRRFLRTQQREEYIVLGKEILEKTFQQEGVEFNEKVLAPALKIFNKDLVDDIYAEVGEGVLTRNQVLEAVFPGRKEEAKPKGFSLFQRRKKTTKSGDHAIPVKGLIPGMAVHFAGCCHPLPGDRIVGIVVTGKGITIHTIDCDTLENFTDTPERWISVSWDEATSYQDAYVGRIRATVSHESGSLATIANIIAKDLGNITNLKILNRSPDFFDLMIDIEVEGVQHLTNIIAALRSSSVVQSVERHHE